MTRTLAEQERPSQFRLGSGLLLDISSPLGCPIDVVTDVADPLSKAPRFNGQPAGPAYVVLEHQTIGSAVALIETGDVDVALRFHLHDAHEGPIGDIATPIAKGIESDLSTTYGPEYGRAFTRVLHGIKGKVQTAIERACHLTFERNEEAERYVHELDGRMFDAEAAMLWHVNDPREQSPVARLREDLRECPTRYFACVIATYSSLDWKIPRQSMTNRMPIDLGDAEPWDRLTAKVAWLSGLAELIEARS